MLLEYLDVLSGAGSVDDLLLLEPLGAGLEVALGTRDFQDLDLRVA